MYKVGVDLGGTNIAVGLVDKNYRIIVKKSAPSGAKRSADAIVSDIAALCLAVCQEKGLSIHEIENVGIATPGIADCDKGEVIYSCNLPFRDYPLTSVIAKKLGLDKSRVTLANDANAAAWGEAVAGAAKGSSDSVMITLGTGVGGGVIVSNKIYTGFNFAGAELGHVVIEVDGAPCTCGRRGCWEAYSSATGLIRMTKEKIEECRLKGIKTSMLSEKHITGRTACDAMRAGDAAAKEVYDQYVRYLAAGITNVVNIFQPQIISLGGGISNEGQPLIDALLPLVRKEQYGSKWLDGSKLTELRIARLGNDAGIIGAAALA